MRECFFDRLAIHQDHTMEGLQWGILDKLGSRWVRIATLNCSYWCEAAIKSCSVIMSIQLPILWASECLEGLEPTWGKSHVVAMFGEVSGPSNRLPSLTLLEISSRTIWADFKELVKSLQFLSYQMFAMKVWRHNFARVCSPSQPWSHANIICSTYSTKELHLLTT